MPIYHIHHLTPLTPTQKDSLADALTTLHSTQFSTLRNFVNVRFRPLDPNDDIYIGGRRRVANHIVASVRAGPSRTSADWNALCAAIHGVWERIVVSDPAPRAKGSTVGSGEEAQLRAIFLEGSLVGGTEAGIPIPAAGEDGVWLERHWGEMCERAEKGEEEWGENVREARERGLVDEALAGKSAQQRLEEMLGWGDAA